MTATRRVSGFMVDILAFEGRGVKVMSATSRNVDAELHV